MISIAHSVKKHKENKVRLSDCEQTMLRDELMEGQWVKYIRVGLKD